MELPQILLVQTTWDQVAGQSAAFATLFYQRLFTRNPQVRMLFSANFIQQKQKLVDAITLAVRGLHEPATILPYVQALGLRHVSYGVKPMHYNMVGEALLWALAQTLQEQFSAELQEAWAEAYALLAHAMQEGAKNPILAVVS